MEYSEFAVCLASLHLPEQQGDAESFALLSADSQRLVRQLYQFFQEKLVASINAFRTAELLDHSLFCFCIPEGMVMLLCTVDPIERRAVLDGFLITQETLRTAWQLSRWKLLFTCAAGWKRYGIVKLSPDEIEQLAMALQVTREQQAKLMEASRRMLLSPAPFSFAVTAYPPGGLPLCFPGTAEEEFTQEAEENGEIVYSAEQAAALAEQYRRDISVLRTLRLCCGSKKHYQAMRLRNTAPFEDSFVLRNALRDEMQEYADEELWYFTVQVKNDLDYLCALRPAVSQKLNDGCAEFADLSAEMERYITDVYKWIEELKKAETEKEINEPKEREPEPPKKGGLFRSLFHKK